MKAALFIWESVSLGERPFYFESARESTRQTHQEQSSRVDRIPSGAPPVAVNNVYTVCDAFKEPPVVQLSIGVCLLSSHGSTWLLGFEQMWDVDLGLCSGWTVKTRLLVNACPDTYSVTQWSLLKQHKEFVLHLKLVVSVSFLRFIESQWSVEIREWHSCRWYSATCWPHTGLLLLPQLVACPAYLARTRRSSPLLG